MNGNMKSDDYLTNIPQSIEKYGLCKTLAVRHETIHLKHILTETFVRKSINLENYLNKINLSVYDYVEHITNRMRRIHYFNRNYTNDINQIVKSDRTNFFPTFELYKGLNNLIVLDFDGVVTETSFYELYKLCIGRGKVEICSANPTVENSWFINRNLPTPNRIHACKGKLKKINCLINLSKKYDYVFYVDNEKEYLEYAWLFGIQTFIYQHGKIKSFSLNSK
jgi:hypothetical protein